MLMKGKVGKKRRIDYEEIFRLRKIGKTIKEIADVMGLSTSGAQYAVQVAMLEHKNLDYWDARDEEYLINQYGRKSDIVIANNLNRTLDDVRRKAKELKLGSKLDNADGVTLSKVARVLWGNRAPFYQKKLIAMGIPYETINYGTSKNYYVVNLDKFFKWAKKHQDELNFCKFEKWIFGKEPAWVDVKRKRDWAEYREKRWEAYI